MLCTHNSSNLLETGWYVLLVVLVPKCACVNSLTTNDAPMRHDLSELSIRLWEFIWGV